jgi:glycine/D-amino acid oxidase-like deaminating enzyme
VSQAPTTDDYRETPVWWEDARLPTLPRWGLPHETDVVIIGAGITGLAAALHLAKSGHQTVVIDKGVLGGGASGRNAGMTHAGLRRPLHKLQRSHGERGRALYEASVDAYRFVQQLAGEVAPDAGYQANGWLYLAHRERKMRGFAAERARREQLGESVCLIEPEDLAEETHCSGFYGGLLTSNGASVHPGQYLSGLARAALGAGAQVHERVAVTRVLQWPSRARFSVNTTAGSIVARQVLAATDGYMDKALPMLRRRIIPIGSYVIATEPLGDALAEDVSPRRRMMTDTRNFLHYWRLTHDNRLIFGGRTSFTPVSLRRARDRLYAAMISHYPRLRGVRVSHAWSGTVGFTFDQLPHIGRMDGVTYAMGYCGSGVAMASWLGTLAGAWVAEDDDAHRPPFATLGFPTIPAYTGWPWFLPIAGLYYHLRDRFL